MTRFWNFFSPPKIFGTRFWPGTPPGTPPDQILTRFWPDFGIYSNLYWDFPQNPPILASFPPNLGDSRGFMAIFYISHELKYV